LKRQVAVKKEGVRENMKTPQKRSGKNQSTKSDWGKKEYRSLRSKGDVEAKFRHKYEGIMEETWGKVKKKKTSKTTTYTRNKGAHGEAEGEKKKTII